MLSRLPIGVRLEIVRRNVHEYLRGREWIDNVCSGRAWKTEYGRTALNAILRVIWPKDFRADVERNVDYKG